jgi:putative flippase GtrA
MKTPMAFWYNNPPVIRYFIISGIMTALSAVLMALFVYEGMGSWQASLIASVIATVPCFFLQRRLTFESNGALSRQAVAFGTLYVLQRVLAAYTAILLIDVLTTGWLVGSFGTVGSVALFGYVVQRFWIFRDAMPLMGPSTP